LLYVLYCGNKGYLATRYSTNIELFFSIYCNHAFFEFLKYNII